MASRARRATGNSQVIRMQVSNWCLAGAVLLLLSLVVTIVRRATLVRRFQDFSTVLMASGLYSIGCWSREVLGGVLLTCGAVAFVAASIVRVCRSQHQREG